MVAQGIKYKLEQKRALYEELKVWRIIKEHPDELGFVLDAKNYKAYLETYTDVGGDAKDAELTKKEFDTVKAFFKNYKG